MIRNYFKTAWRSLLKGKSFSFINIAGLSIGMAGAVLIFLWLYNEISFDKFHANKDNLYQLYGLASEVDGHQQEIPVVSEPIGPFLKQNYPEVEAVARVRGVNSFLFTVNNKSFTGIRGDFVDPSFLQMFTFPLVEGNKNNQLENVYSICITQNLARKLFGNEDAIGKIIRIDSVDNFTVTGILKNLPSNTEFDFEYLVAWDYLRKIDWNNDSWRRNNTKTFLQLKPNVNAAAFSEKIKNVTRVQTGRNNLWTHFIYPLRKWHLYNNFENGKPAGGRIQTVYIFGIIALFILLIACINFMNLSTARSEQRAKEVGIRKVAGAGKSLLIGQFIIEAFITTCIAGLIAILIVQLALPSYNTLVKSQLFVPYSSGYFCLCVLIFILFTSLLAGSYPAFYLSSFKPVSIFKKHFKRPNASISPRKVLVVVQFTFAIILIVSTIIIRNQIIYAEDRDKGYSNNNLVQVSFAGDIDKNYSLIKQDMINAGIASSITKSMTGITNGGAHAWGYRWPNENPADTNTTITLYSTDADLVKTMGMHLVDGRDIDINKYPADSFSVLINEAAVEVMGFKHPVGQIISNPSDKINWRIVGVIKNYVQGSPYERIPPTIILGPANSWFSTMHIKFNPNYSTADALAKTALIFKKYNAAYSFDYKFVDEEYAKKFDDEQRTKTMAGLFAFLAIFISCLGLFGLSAYVAESRIKEIGVRKVLGASVINITKLLSVDFIKLVIISIVIATPAAWYFMNRWLDKYNYKIALNWQMFAVAGLMALVIALITVSFQSIKAAISSPVKSLRTE